MVEYPVRLTKKSMYSDSTSFIKGKVTANSIFDAKTKARELAAKTELRLSASFIIKIEIQTDNKWEEG